MPRLCQYLKMKEDRQTDSHILYEHSQHLCNIAVNDLIQTSTPVCDLHTIIVYVQPLKKLFYSLSNIKQTVKLLAAFTYLLQIYHYQHTECVKI